MHRHSPLMRSPLSQSQTPTSPRRAVGFFRSGCPAGYPAELITQSTSDWLILLEPILSIIDGAKVKRLVDHCQCLFSVQCLVTAGLHTSKCNPLKRRTLTEPSHLLVLVFHKVLHNSVEKVSVLQGNQLNSLTVGTI
jgi:hypothetical protein